MLDTCRSGEKTLINEPTSVYMCCLKPSGLSKLAFPGEESVESI